MTEHPITFMSEMVRAILDGTKTQTRRVLKPQLPEWFDSCHVLNEPQHPGIRNAIMRYGQSGDRLWVRETWRSFTGQTPEPGCVIDYKATGCDRSAIRWRPSIYMPRWASRLLLEIIHVRVDKVASICEADAIAEGLFQRCGDVHPELTEYSCGDGFWTTKPRTAFFRLWDSINSKPKPAGHNPYTNQREKCQVAYPSDAVREETTINRKASPWHDCKVYVVGNPFVWPISFKRL